MYPMTIAIFALLIVLGYEIRYRSISEEVDKLRASMIAVKGEIAKIKTELSMKQNVYKEFEGPKKQ